MWDNSESLFSSSVDVILVTYPSSERYGVRKNYEERFSVQLSHRLALFLCATKFHPARHPGTIENAEWHLRWHSAWFMILCRYSYVCCSLVYSCPSHHSTLYMSHLPAIHLPHRHITLTTAPSPPSPRHYFLHYNYRIFFLHYNHHFLFYTVITTLFSTFCYHHILYYTIKSTFIPCI